MSNAIHQTRKIVASMILAGFTLTLPSMAFAQAADAVPAAASATSNAIEAIEANQQAGNVVVKVTLKEAPGDQLGSFSVSNPARVAIDFPKTSNSLGSNAKTLNQGDVRSANIVQVGDRTRLVLNLTRSLAYETKVEGRDVFITLSSAAAKGSNAAPTIARFAEQKGGPDQHSIKNIAFRRGKDGEARLVVDLSDPKAGIDIRQQGSNLLVEFSKTSLPAELRKRLDVTDFGTPVTSVSTTTSGDSVKMVITPKGLWEHQAYQTDNQFVLEVKPIVEDPRKLVQGGTTKYSGEKLSLNFQNIDIRSVLQVIADFTNFNIITSDSVAGNLTLRLKDVPWDQALDIILQAKGLDLRKNGNVILIAPRDELAAKEKLELESKAQITDLEPIRTENFQINYHKAKAIFEILKDKDRSLLSKRGSAVVDERTNKLFVTDTGGRLDDIRKLITEVDIPVRQVVIEAQIVEASDTFTRNLGARIGFNLIGREHSGGNPRVSFGGGLANTAFNTGQVTDTPTLGDSLGFNNPAPAIAGKNAGQMSLILWNTAATRFLNLEISALEADGRGKVVSRPKVMTADQNEALIEQGVEIPFQEATSSGATSVSFRKANLALKVKPHITPDGRIYLTLDVNKDTPNTRIATGAGVAIDTKHIKTEVMVENGGTVVIGGIYQQEIRNTTSKVPFFGDIPVLGYLFRENERGDDKTELLVFVTPRIVAEQQALK